MRSRAVASAFDRAVVAAFVLVWAQPAGAQPYAYVTNAGSNSVSVIDTALSAVVATIPVGQNPTDVAVGFGASRIYVANAGSGTLSVINAHTQTVVATVPVGVGANGVAVTPGGDRVYVAATDRGVTVIDTATNTIAASVPLTGAHGIAISPDGTRAYVTSLNENSVVVLDTSTHARIGTPISVGPTPFHIAVSPTGTEAYVTNGGSGSVSVIDTAAHRVAVTLPAGGNSLLFGVTAAGDGSRIWFANSTLHRVAAIDTVANVIVTEYATGGLKPLDVDVSSDGSRLYVANMDSNTLAVLNTTTGEVSTIPVGIRPHGVAIAATQASRTFAASVFASDVSYGLPGGDAQVTFGASVTLAPDSDGVQPLTDALRLGIGPFNLQIPAGAFQVATPALFWFSGPLGSLAVDAVIQSTGGGQYVVVLQARGRTIPPIPVPARIRLFLGNDFGAIDARRGVVW